MNYSKNENFHCKKKKQLDMSLNPASDNDKWQTQWISPLKRRQWDSEGIKSFLFFFTLSLVSSYEMSF